tara:strand:+ start:21647 stop:22630 length:984 start_codon:yes stop_codon:yes gene_type:complete
MKKLNFKLKLIFLASLLLFNTVAAYSKKKEEVITYQNYLSPFFRASPCFDEFDKKGLKKKKIQGRFKKGILGTYGGLSLASGTLGGGLWIIYGITRSLTAGHILSGAPVMFALGAAIPGIYLAPVPIAMVVAFHVSNRMDNAGFALEAVACANGDDCSGKKLKKEFLFVSQKVPSRRTIKDFSMTISRGLLSGKVCKLSKKLPRIGRISKFAQSKLKNNSYDPQKLSYEEKAKLYKGFVIMKFSKMDLKRPNSKINILKRKRIRDFESRVKIEISSIQRLLRDIEKFRSYHDLIPKKEQKDLKEYKSLRSELKGYLYELIKALSKKN